MKDFDNYFDTYMVGDEYEVDIHSDGGVVLYDSKGITVSDIDSETAIDLAHAILNHFKEETE